VIDHEHGVLELKLYLLGQMGFVRALPGVLALRFFGCELEDAELLWAYGIPHGATLDAELLIGGEIQVALLEEEEIAYAFAPTDTAAALLERAGLANRELCDVFAGDVIMGPGEPLSALAGARVCVRRTRRLAAFTGPAGEFTALVPINGTVADAIAAVAERTGMPAHNLQLSAGGEPLPPTGSLASLSEPLRIIRLADVTFHFKKSTLTLSVDAAAPLAAACRALAPLVQLPPEAIILKLGDAVVDDKATVEELGAVEFGMEQSVAADGRDVELFLQIGVVPRRGVFRLPAHATARDAQEAARSRWELGDLMLEIVVWDFDSAEAVPIDGDAVLAEVEVAEGRALVVRPAGGGAVLETEHEGTLATLGAGRADAGIRMTVTGFGGTTTLLPGEAKYGFALGEKVFHLKFAADATVRDARVKVAQTIGVENAECVTLLAVGKALKDGFILGRLRLGDKPVTVHVRDGSEVVILTAKANRR
jgi:hypothetical protein